ncbi:MAG: hypothetical protein K8R46_13215 [Pirellulales bacterium]|nr:hypothetical protein [Pirellulales bacterium]
MIITDIQKQGHDGCVELSASIKLQSAGFDQFRVWYRFPEEFNSPVSAGDAMLVAFVVPCMLEKEDIYVDDVVSKELLGNLPVFQKTISKWFPALSPVSITVLGTHQKLPVNTSEKQVASFFSGGVDSWYTLLKNKDEISHIICVNGLDIRKNDPLWRSTKDLVRDIAKEYGKLFVPVETNARFFVDPRRKTWGKDFTGSPHRSHVLTLGGELAAVGMCLQHNISQIFIASSVDSSKKIFLGTHPLLDPLWSTENVLFVEDGFECNRLEKVKTLMDEPFVLSHLRVCGRNLKGIVNCCACEKCTRMMMSLRVLGKTDISACFPKPIDFKLVKRLSLRPTTRKFYLEILEEALKVNDREVVDAIRIALGRRFSFYRLLNRMLDRFVESQCFKRLYMKLSSGSIRYIKDGIKRWSKLDMDQYYKRNK